MEYRKRRQKQTVRRVKNGASRQLELKRRDGVKGHLIRAFWRHGSYNPEERVIEPHSDTSSTPVRLALAVYDKFRIVRHIQGLLAEVNV